MKVWREEEGKGAAAVRKALGRYDSHVNVLKVCDNGLLHRSSKGGRGRENHNLHLKFESKQRCVYLLISSRLQENWLQHTL